MNCKTTSRASGKERGSWVHVCLHEQFDDICNSMDCSLSYYVFGFLWCYITDRNNFNGACKDESGRRSLMMLCFQINLDSAYSIKVIASVFGGNVDNARCQRAINIVILVNPLESWYKGPLDIHLDHLLFPLTAILITAIKFLLS